MTSRPVAQATVCSASSYSGSVHVAAERATYATRAGPSRSAPARPRRRPRPASRETAARPRRPRPAVRRARARARRRPIRAPPWVTASWHGGVDAIQGVAGQVEAAVAGRSRTSSTRIGLIALERRADGERPVDEVALRREHLDVEPAPVRAIAAPEPPSRPATPPPATRIFGGRFAGMVVKRRPASAAAGCGAAYVGGSGETRSPRRGTIPRIGPVTDRRPTSSSHWTRRRCAGCWRPDGRSSSSSTSSASSTTCSASPRSSRGPATRRSASSTRSAAELERFVTAGSTRTRTAHRRAAARPRRPRRAHQRPAPAAARRTSATIRGPTASRPPIRR